MNKAAISFTQTVSDSEWVKGIWTLSPSGVDVPERLCAYLRVSLLEQERRDQMDGREDIVNLTLHTRGADSLADDVPQESSKARCVEDHELEQAAFQADVSADEGVEAHA